MKTWFVKFFKLTIDGFLSHKCGLHAAGLTYFTLLTFVPILCLLLLLAKTCGVGDIARNQINLRIDSFIVQLENAQAVDDATMVAEKTTKNGDESKQASSQDAADKREQKRQASKMLATQARELSNQLFDRIDKFDVSTLGWVGLILLAWSVISTFGMVETSMNEVWEVKKPRPIWKRSLLYLFESLVLPLLLMFAMSMPVLRLVKTVLDYTVGATVYTKWVGDAIVALINSQVFSFLLAFFFISLAFAFVLAVMPNVKVRARPAFLAGMITAVAFCSWLKICTAAQIGIANSSALYGSFALLPILLAWIYMSWQIILLGVCMAYAFQNLNNFDARSVRA